MTMKEAALKYAQHGWRIFPCSANAKTPLAGSHGVKDATNDASKIEEWWTAHPDANIGLACGAASGVYVVDVDVRPDTGIDGFGSISSSGKDLPKTLSQTTPSGGAHFLYKCTGEPPANKNGFLKGVDIRGDGYYIIVSPSVVNGREYKWNDGSDMDEFPDAFRPERNLATTSFAALPAACLSSSANDIERARAYLAEIPGAVEHVDGHAKLFWVAQVLVNGFRLPDEDAERLMWDEYNPRCSPPWNRNRSTEREFRHKIDEARRKPNAEAVSIYEACSEYNLSDGFDFDECVKDVRELIAPKVANVSAPVAKKDAVLNDLLVPNGLVGDIAAWINETAGCYQPLFALGASLALCGAVFGRKVCDESNGRTNIFCMGVGHSSSGKDHPGDCVSRILSMAGASHLLMGRMTSDSAIEKALGTSPVKLALLDEVGHFFSNINAAGENSAYLKTIKPTLMELFSSSHKTYLGKEKATGRPAMIEQPCVCIWGVTAPQKLYNGMTIEELQDGWIARNLIFISETRPQYVMKPFADPPQGIVEAVRAWAMRSSGEVQITAAPGGGVRPLVVKMDSRAQKVFNSFSKSAHESMIAAHSASDKTEYLWGKAFQNARRIALIVACGKEYEQPVIGEYEAEYGCRLVEMLVRTTAISIAANVSESKWEREKNRIRSIIDASGSRGLTKTDIIRRTQWVKGARERNEYLSDLIDAGVVRIFEKKPLFGKPTKVYMAANLANQMEIMQGVDHVEAE